MTTKHENKLREIEITTASLWLAKGAIEVAETGAENTYFINEWGHEFFCKDFPNQNSDAHTHTPKTKMNIIESHTNAAGTIYYSTTDENGQKIYSFDGNFEDIWTLEDQAAIESGSTPSKIQ